MPCHDCANPPTSQPPVTSFASLMAASLASPPVDNSMTFGSCGASSAKASARSTTGRLSSAEHRAHLAGGEVQYAPASIIVENRALGPNRHEIDELAAIFQEVTPNAWPK